MSEAQNQEEYPYGVDEEENLANPPTIISDVDKILKDKLPDDLTEEFFIFGDLRSLKLSNLSEREISILMDELWLLFHEFESSNPDQVDNKYRLKKKMAMITIKAQLNRSKDGFERTALVTSIMHRFMGDAKKNAKKGLGWFLGREE